MRLLSLPKEWQKNTFIPIEKIFDDNVDLFNEVISIQWYGCVKPKVAEVTATTTERTRYEEIHLFEIVIQSRRYLYEIAKVFSSKIKYPCVVEYKIADATVIGICAFNAGKIDYSENVNKRIRFTHFLRPECLSSLARKQVAAINEALITNGDIADIYAVISNVVSNYSLGGTTRAHVDRLIVDMLGKATTKQKEEIRQYCIPFEYHAEKYKNSKYKGIKQSNYTLIHDYEEIWYCFMQNPKTRNVIANRRYRDIEDLIYSIDSKSW